MSSLGSKTTTHLSKSLVEMFFFSTPLSLPSLQSHWTVVWWCLQKMSLCQHPHDNFLKFLCGFSLGNRTSHPVFHLQLITRYSRNRLHEPVVNTQGLDESQLLPVVWCRNWFYVNLLGEVWRVKGYSAEKQKPECLYHWFQMLRSHEAALSSSSLVAHLPVGLKIMSIGKQNIIDWFYFFSGFWKPSIFYQQTD